MDFKNQPEIIEETSAYAVVYKPPKMHCTPGEYGYTLFDWYKANSTSVFDIMHRLDYETHGLVLFARNETSFKFFKDLQDKGEFVKEYSAVCVQSDLLTPGFPPAPPPLPPLLTPATLPPSVSARSLIESYFRPFGPGRKLVRPVIDDGKKHKEIAKDKGNFYKTEIVNINNNIFTVQLKRGFRHQIRCHLCWIGYPILNDPLYSPGNAETCIQKGELALRSHALFFANPANGEYKECKIDAIVV